MTSVRERLEGGLLGLLVGDALGVPYEFNPPHAIPPRDQIEMKPPPGFRPAHGVRPGTYSDDGAQALCLLASLLHSKKLDLADFGNRLVNWLDHGHLAVDNHVFDVGIQTRRGLGAIRSGVSSEQAGPSDERSNGNGALMRALPMALWHKGTDSELIIDAERQGLPTHGHVRSQVCCAVYCVWARNLLVGKSEALPLARTSVATHHAKDANHLKELDRIFSDENPPPKGSGYVLDSLLSTFECLKERDYESVVKAAIALGNDTDTTACIAGGIAGIAFGVESIPKRWRDTLQGKEHVQPLLDGLLKHHGV